MPASALALALLAAAVHAAWNLLLAGADDPERAGPVGMALGAAMLLPFAVVLWDVDAAAWPFIAASAAFHVAYMTLLARAYGRADVGFVYPIARGAGPVLVLVVGVAFLGVHASVAEALGVLGVVGGILLVRGVRPGRGLALALAVGTTIGGYTLVDDRGVDHAAAVPYLATMLAATSVVLLAAEHARGHRIRAVLTPRTAAVGAGAALAYLLVLLALQRADAAPVAAVRETSVLMALLAVAVTGRERVTPGRAAGAALVVAGIAALALG